jgi:hypothetical protein
MSSAAGNQAATENAAAATSKDNASNALSAYNNDISEYMGNVNSALSQGNPYQSKDYLTQQNIDTSGAMNSENNANQQALGSTVAKTGTNSAALANTISSSKREGQRDLTQYNAGRDTSNEHAWQSEKQGLLQDELGGTNSEAGVYGSSLNSEDSLYGTAQSGENAQTQANNAATFGPFYHG